MANHEQLQPITIAVMGVTGVGKSYFIEKATGHKVEIGGGLESCTSEIASYSVAMPPYLVHLVDTPGFDDSSKNDADILSGIAQFLAAVYKQTNAPPLSGILYMHQITDNKMKGSALKNLKMFQQLIGDRCLKNCVLITSKWGLLPYEVGEARERELLSKPQFWQYMVANGSTTKRFQDTRDSAWEIIGTIAGLKGCTPHLTDEICNGHKKLKDTAAGRIVEVDINEKLREKQGEIELARREAEEAIARNDVEMQAMLAEQKAALTKQMEDLRNGQAVLEQKYEDERKVWNNNRHEYHAAHAQRKNNSEARNAKRAVFGFIGGAAILLTGGLAAPLVAVAAGVNEAKNYDQRKNDKTRLKNAS